MERKTVQLNLRSERREFKNKLKVHCKLNRVSQRSISDELGITEQEFHNMLTGYQSSIPTKNIFDFEQFKQEILSFLCVTSL